MQIYNYHPEYGFFVGIETADESPLEPGVFLIPAYSTTEVPPTVGEGQLAIFTDTGWQVGLIPPPPEPEPVVAPPDPPTLVAPPPDPTTVSIQPATTGPDWSIFLDLLINTELYQSIVVQSTSNPVVNTGLTITMGALLLAAGGRPNVAAIQAGVTFLFAALTATPENLVELNGILAQAKITAITLPEVPPSTPPI